MLLAILDTDVINIQFCFCHRDGMTGNIFLTATGVLKVQNKII